jgi:cytochrome c peroxidase
MLAEDMSAVRRLFVVTITAALVACAIGPSESRLDADNPVKPIDPPPFGMEEFFAASASQPAPARVRLGRWLFFDSRLSSDRTLSCASCHKPEVAFSETTAVATGIGNQRGRRKTPSIVNLAARTSLPDTIDDPGPTFFWDGRARSLEAQVLMPIADAREMGFTHADMLARLSQIDAYARYFEEAFGSRDITTSRVASALADYVRTRRSGNAPYDRWAYGRDTHALSKAAQRGSEIFFFSGGCASCHAGFNFSDGLFHSLGIGWDPQTQAFGDVGRAAVSHDPKDLGAFKTPGLREVSKHPPYMHDGSLATLRDVVEFYNRGGNPSPRRSARVRPLHLSPEDIDAVVAFLKSLDGEGYADRSPRLFPQ